MVASIVDESAVHIVDNLIRDAISRSASDIHLEPGSNALRVRFRIDGMLYDQPSINGSKMYSVLARIKILSHVNIAEKRLPQDGRFSMRYDAEQVDIRVSTFPSVYGEKIVLRILDRSAHMINLDHLGFASIGLERIKALLSRSSGFFLVTGPTGSGKTTTLYAALALLNRADKNIITLEDPVEYNLEGITQGHIHPDAGFTFAKGMRSLLRQDPDVAMVGEIRDKETAQIAIEASLTGHVVLSTLHTNNAPSALIRLMDMGIEPFLLNAAITGIVAQRLARKNCSSCTEPIEPTCQEEALVNKLKLPITQLFKGKGCERCFGIGMIGRVGIFELLEPTHALQALLSQHPVLKELQEQALQDGMLSLLHDGAHKVNNGLISLHELLRVVS